MLFYKHFDGMDILNGLDDPRTTLDTTSFFMEGVSRFFMIGVPKPTKLIFSALL